MAKSRRKAFNCAQMQPAALSGKPDRGRLSEPRYAARLEHGNHAAFNGYTQAELSSSVFH
jgi:hypothetical protein